MRLDGLRQLRTRPEQICGVVGGAFDRGEELFQPLSSLIVLAPRGTLGLHDGPELAHEFDPARDRGEGRPAPSFDDDLNAASQVMAPGRSALDRASGGIEPLESDVARISGGRRQLRP